MSAPHYTDMASVWDEHTIAPQLELEEYGQQTPASFALHQNAMSATRHDLPPSSYPAFNPAFPQSAQQQQHFNFTVQPPHQQGVNGGQGFFPAAGPSSATPQNRSPSFAPQSMFPGSHAMDTAGFQDPSMYPPYAAHDQFNSPPMGFPQQYPPGSQQGSPYIPTGFDEPFGSAGVKRQRRDDGVYFEDQPADDKDAASGKQDAANKRPACTRCKQLKVRCEPSLDDPDICKRCFRGGSDCTIPGRKKRKPPPKRELLLNQIRDQAESIKALMAKLEEANKKAERAQAAQTSNAPSPASTTDFSFISLSDSRLMSPEIEGCADDANASPAASAAAASRSNADVQDWIAKARASIQAFDGYINMGGSSVARSALVADEGSDPEGEHDDDDDADVAVTVEDADDEAPSGSADDDDNGTDRGHRRLSSTSEQRPKREQRLATIPSPAAPFGLMARMTLEHRPLRKMKSKSSVGAEDDDEEDVGLANPDFFRAAPAPERPPVNMEGPHILRSGLITVAEAEKLIQIYWDYMNLSVSLLDPKIYTTQYLVVYSPFLFTVICGIASRFYTERPELYQKAMHFARLAAGTALIGGQKSVDIVHAYILLALYPVPSRKWEDDRSWIYLGVAIRIAMDLNLHHPNTAKPKDEMHARVLLNRTRAWLNCFNLDRSTGSQYGKGPIISSTDYVANRSAEWWRSSDHNMRGFDIHLACYNADLTILGRFRETIHSDPNSPTGFNKNLDIADLASKADDELATTWGRWIALIRENTDVDDRQSTFRTGLLRLAYSYARMTVLSFGFQYAFGKSSVGRDVDLLNRCLRAAMDVLAAVLDDIARPEQKVFLRHGPEAQSVFATFACAFLIKLMQPRYAGYLDQQQRDEIRQKVQRMINLLGSPEVAIDDHHSPKLYSRFLQGLLDKLQSSRRLKAKSESPAAHKIELHDARGAALLRQSRSSPASVRDSASPEPAQSVLLEPFGGAMTQEPSELMPIDAASEFFAPPLPFNDLPSMNDSSILGVPGFAWMSAPQPEFQLGFYPHLANAP
ncbi:hypothetical protein PHLGIDRAFT_159580 [Phlebiopsis gigantea 11061_1 CR5-6]|uniref:Zn(2)-C6 fungal-type domain-containing protein n=1 Tax=Phlebiopsis gigantea (strain 11061_1 CR5-6) TaxID=745531 RepID=A0A0C3SCT8_PHLG1|nr:hypothetical protein PHLGIDRAFT_159580 [Phlebiopsis gigantea 11061_1 CR5-6]